MNVLIVENEVYLARSIDAKLSSLGYCCHTASNLQEALNEQKYDAVLLSTNLSGQSFYPVIEKHKESVIILMVSYISNDTVTKPIKAGANDYIQKPFMIEELIRKLNHLKEFRELEKENLRYKNYLKHLFKNVKEFEINKKIRFPILLKSASQKSADCFMFKLSNMLRRDFKIISLSEIESAKKLELYCDGEINYIVNFELIKKNEKMKILNLIKGKDVVLVSSENDEVNDINCIDLNTQNDDFEASGILSIEDYIKYIIDNYQNRFPDTELSKKLGISRKSLWEKRKKYGIERDK